MKNFSECFKGRIDTNGLSHAVCDSDIINITIEAMIECMIGVKTWNVKKNIAVRVNQGN